MYINIGKSVYLHCVYTGMYYYDALNPFSFIFVVLAPVPPLSFCCFAFPFHSNPHIHIALIITHIKRVGCVEGWREQDVLDKIQIWLGLENKTRVGSGTGIKWMGWVMPRLCSTRQAVVVLVFCLFYPLFFIFPLNLWMPLAASYASSKIPLKSLKCFTFIYFIAYIISLCSTLLHPKSHSKLGKVWQFLSCQALWNFACGWGECLKTPS